MDGIRYLLVKDNSRLRYGKNNNEFYTYKINKENNYNYIENLPKNKKRMGGYGRGLGMGGYY